MFLNLSNNKNLFIFSLILFSCASVKAPQGGPLDLIPPILESTTPSVLTGLQKNQKIILSFNEFIKEESLKNAIEIFPIIDEKIDYEYQGKNIGNDALAELIRKNPRERYLANVNPKNKKSSAFFKNNNFKLIQHTYEMVLE